MASSTSKNKAPSMLKQSLITSGFILLWGIMCTIFGKSAPAEEVEDKCQPVSSESINRDTKLGALREALNEKLDACLRRVGRPQQWVVSLYDFSLALFPIFLVVYATLSAKHPKLEAGWNGMMSNWSGDIVGIAWAISFLGYAFFAVVILVFPLLASYVCPPKKKKRKTGKKRKIKRIKKKTLPVPWGRGFALIFMAILYIAVPALTDTFFEYDIVKESLVVMGFALLNTCLAGLLLRLPKGYRKAVAINSK